MKTIDAFESRFGGWVIAWRWPIIAATIVLVGVAASGTIFLRFSADYLIYFDKDNPQLLAYEAMDHTYGTSDNVLFAIVPDDRDATSALSLEAAAWLTEQSWKLPYASRVDSITNFQHAMAHGDDILIRDLVDEAALADDDERSRIRAIALAEPRLAGNLIARDGGVSGVNVTVQLPGEDELLEGAQVAEAVDRLAGKAR